MGHDRAEDRGNMIQNAFAVDIYALTCSLHVWMKHIGPGSAAFASGCIAFNCATSFATYVLKLIG